MTTPDPNVDPDLANAFAAINGAYTGLKASLASATGTDAADQATITGLQSQNSDLQAALATAQAASQTNAASAQAAEAQLSTAETQIGALQAQIAAAQAATPASVRDLGPLFEAMSPTTLGCYVGGDNDADQVAIGVDIGRPLRVKRLYLDASTTNSGHPEKNASVLAACADGGAVIHLNFAGMIWTGTSLATQAPQPQGNGRPHPYFTFDQINAGVMDPIFAQWKAGLAALVAKYPAQLFMVTFMAESDLQYYVTDPACALSTYPALQHRAHDQMMGPNCYWVPVFSGWQADDTIYTRMWGVGSAVNLDSITDMVMNDPYINAAANDVSHLLAFRNRVLAGLLGPVAKTKPFGFSEWGISNKLTNRGALLALCPAAFAAAGVRVAAYWSSTAGGYDYTLGADLPAFEAMAKQFG